MDNPFEGLKEKRAYEEHRRQTRDALYETYSPLVNEVLDEMIAAYNPGAWKKGSDSDHPYCCHVGWYAGPEEKHKASYDERHEIRRFIEILLEVDASCSPTGFKVINHDNFNKCVEVGISRKELVRGVLDAFE